LTHIYTGYEPLLDDVGEAKIDRKLKRVSVRFADDTLPRISVWRPHLGCTALPQGAGEDFIKELPRIKLKAPPEGLADIMWPAGDKLPDTPLPNSVNVTALEAAIGQAFSGDFGGRTSAVIISQNGRLLSERYKHGHTKFTWRRGSRGPYQDGSKIKFNGMVA